MLAIAAATTMVAAAAGALLAQEHNPLHLERVISWQGLTFLLLAAPLSFLLLHRPGLALAPLVLCIYLNLSEILVRYHGLPSLLQFAVLPLVVGAWWEGTTKDHRLRITAAPLAGMLVAYSALLWLSTLWANDVELADQRVIEVAKALALYALIAALVTTRRRLQTAISGAVAGAGLLAGLGLWQVATGAYGSQFGGLARIKYAQIYGDHFEPRIAGPLGDPNFFAQILCLAVPLALALAASEVAPWRRWAARGMAGLMAAALIFTYSRGTALALALVLVLWALDRGLRPRTLAAGAALLLAGALLLPDGFTRRLTTLTEILPGEAQTLHPDSSFAKRRLLVRGGWEMFTAHPLRGVGPANFTVHFETYADEVGSGAREYDDPAGIHYPHNLFLEIAAETGLLGLALFNLALVACFGQLSAARRRYLDRGDPGMATLTRGVQIGLVGYLASSLFLHGHYPRYLWLLFALATAVWSLSRIPDQERPHQAAGSPAGLPAASETPG